MADSSKDITLDQYIAGQCTRGEVKTPFATSRDMDQMKAMLRDASPDTVLKVAGAWKQLSDTLATGDASIKATFDQAVAHIMQHWEGEAAQGFQAKAQTISKSIQDTATYAEYTSIAMKSAGTVLDQIKPQVMAMEKPSGLASAWDYATDLGDRSDAYKNDLDKTDSGGAQNALDKDSGSLSAGKEAQLQMAAKMETLAVTYTSQAATMGTWNKAPATVIDDHHDVPGEPGGIAPVPVVLAPNITAPTTGSSRGTTSSGAGKASLIDSPTSEVGISGGKPTPKPIGTSVDGISGGLGNNSGVGGGREMLGTGGSIGSPGGAPGSGTTVGMPGAGAGSAGVGAAGRGMGGSTLNRSIPIGSAAGAANASGEAESVRGRSLARMRGGAVGEAEEDAPGRRLQGGSGLHQSRGAEGKGKVGSKSRNPIIGHGSNDNREEEEERTDQRPDYLIEDEETWVPEGSVAPRVIE